MQSDLSRNYFELFDIPVSFDIDESVLTSRYRELQRLTHPDRYATATDQERGLSVQMAAQINEAYRVLGNTLSRARYLLELQGIEIDDKDTTMDPVFLMEQMEMREALDDAHQSENPQAALMHLMQDIESRIREYEEQLSMQFGDGSREQLEKARATMREMQFLDRVHQETEDLEDELSTIV